MAPINEGIKRALAIIISWCANEKREQDRKAKKGSNQIWACSFSAFGGEKMTNWVNGWNTIVAVSVEAILQLVFSQPDTSPSPAIL